MKQHPIRTFGGMKIVFNDKEAENRWTVCLENSCIHKQVCVSCQEYRKLNEEYRWGCAVFNQDKSSKFESLITEGERIHQWCTHILEHEVMTQKENDDNGKL